MAEETDLLALVGRARLGDTEAFGILVVRFGAAVRAHCLLRAADPSRADDLAQQVFLTAWKRLPSLQSDVAFWPWLEAITRHHLMNEWRRLQRERGLKARYTVAWLAQSEAEESLPEDAEELALRVESLRGCLGQLPPAVRNLVKLRYDENRSSQEIGASLGRSAESVRQALVRVREKLRECVERRMAGGGVA